MDLQVASNAFRTKVKVDCLPPLVRCAHDPHRCCAVTILQAKPVGAPRAQATHVLFYQQEFENGAAIEYHSSRVPANGGWISAKVVRFHPESGLYDLDIRTNVPMQKLRRATARPQTGLERQFNDNDAVEYMSSQGWIPSKVVGFGSISGLYDLDIGRRVPAERLRRPTAVLVDPVIAMKPQGTNTGFDDVPKPACTAQRQPEGGSVDGPLVIAIGDSLTEGRDAPCPGHIPGSCLWWAGSCARLGVTRESAKTITCGGEMDPWPSQLQRMIPGYRVLNRGCYGQTLEQMIERVRSEIPPHIKNRIAVVTVMAGTNNLWSSTASTQYVSDKLVDLHKIIKEELAPNAKLVVMTIPQGGPGMVRSGRSKVQEINRFLQGRYSNRQQEGLYFIDTHTGLDYSALDRTGHPMTYNSTHFGPDGYAQIAERVFSSGAFE